MFYIKLLSIGRVVMSASDDFNWYWLHELGSLLLVRDEEAYLRTAINRFYFSAFCELGLFDK